MAPVNDDDAPPRTSTLRHMRKLMATAAAIGVAAVTTRGQTATVDVDATSSNDASPGAAQTPSEPDAAGYVVVDPIPPPASRGCSCGKPGMNTASVGVRDRRRE